MYRMTKNTEKYIETTSVLDSEILSVCLTSSKLLDVQI